MDVWKRRMAVLVGAVASAGLLVSSAEAREPRDRDGFDVPEFTTPTNFFDTPSTSPPPTMPPSSTPSTSPPPTMPPPTTTPPPTMPPPTVPSDFDEEIEDIIDTLEEFGDVFQEIIDFLSNPLGG